MRQHRLTGAELPCPITPEYLRLYHLANHIEKDRQRRVEAGRRALAAANKLKNPAQKKIPHIAYFFRAQQVEGCVMKMISRRGENVELVCLFCGRQFLCRENSAQEFSWYHNFHSCGKSRLHRAREALKKSLAKARACKCAH